MVHKHIFTQRHEGHDYPYLGSESDEDTIEPSIIDALKIVRSGKKATLVLPFCTKKGIGLIHRYFDPSLEYVVNDFGVLRLLLNKGVIPIIGRLLSSQFFVVDKKVIPFPSLGILFGFGIRHFEISCLHESMILPENMKISLYYPWAPVTHTRRESYNGENLSLPSVKNKIFGFGKSHYMIGAKPGNIGDRHVLCKLKTNQF